MRRFGRLTLRRKVPLIQVGIVLLVAGMISATVVSALARLVEERGASGRWASPGPLANNRRGSTTCPRGSSTRGWWRCWWARQAWLPGEASVAPGRGITFSVSPRSRPGPTNGLSDVLATVTGNLIENASDAVEGQARREVTVNPRDRDGEIRAEVRDSGPRDSGPGVPRPLVGRMCEAGLSTKEAGHGPRGPGLALVKRGPGLALVKRLVTRHGGDVAVRNQGGAIFTVRLPRAASGAPNVPSRGPA